MGSNPPSKSRIGQGLNIGVKTTLKAPGDTEKMALITVDTDVVLSRRKAEGENFNLWSRTPGAYRRLVQ
jgi:hypothetical protein